MPDDDRGQVIEANQLAQLLGQPGTTRKPGMAQAASLSVPSTSPGRTELRGLAPDGRERAPCVGQLDEARTEATQAVEILRSSPTSEQREPASRRHPRRHLPDARRLPDAERLSCSRRDSPNSIR